MALVYEVRGGGALKKIAPSENFGVFRVKNHDYTPKNHIFSTSSYDPINQCHNKVQAQLKICSVL
jgi:hypothetical protein